MEVSLQTSQPKLPHLELITGTLVFQSDSLHGGQLTEITTKAASPWTYYRYPCVSVWQPPRRSGQLTDITAKAASPWTSYRYSLCFSVTASMEVSLQTLQPKLPHLEPTTGTLVFQFESLHGGQLTLVTYITAKAASPWTHYRYSLYFSLTASTEVRSVYWHCSQSCLTLNSLQVPLCFSLTGSTEVSLH